MKNKSLLLAGFVCVCSFAFAGTKSYSVSFDKTALVGNVQLTAGDYKLTCENGTATFTDARTHKSVSTPVKVETTAKKAPHTAVDVMHEGKAERVAAILLGGSTTKLEFPAGPPAAKTPVSNTK